MRCIQIIGGFPSQWASNAEGVSIKWRFFANINENIKARLNEPLWTETTGGMPFTQMGNNVEAVMSWRHHAHTCTRTHTRLYSIRHNNTRQRWERLSLYGRNEMKFSFDWDHWLYRWTVICNLDVSSYRILWFITSLFRGTLNKITFNQTRLSFADVIWPADHPWLGWAGFVQPPVYKISPHSWLTSCTTWWSGVPGRERLTRQHPLKITTQLSACETSWVNMPLSLKYLNLQVTISIKMLFFETVSSKNVCFAIFKLIWCMTAKWIHKPLPVEIKSVFVYIKQYSSKQGAVLLNKQLPN